MGTNRHFARGAIQVAKEHVNTLRIVALGAAWTATMVGNRRTRTLATNTNHSATPMLDRRCRQNGAAPLGTRLAFSFKTKRATYRRSSSGTLGHLAQRDENLRSRKDLYTNVHRGRVCNNPGMETTQTPFHG